MGLKHFFHSTKADPSDPTIIGATKWNDDHYYVDGAGAPVGNVGAVLLAGAAGALTHLNSVAAGMVLTSAGVGALPVWAAGGVPAALAVTSLTASSHVAVGTNPAQSGAIRLANTQGIYARNPSNGADRRLLDYDTIERLNIGGTGVTYVWFTGTEVVFDSNAFNLQSAYIQMTIRAAPPVPPAGSATLWLRDAGGGKTQLVVQFDTGAAIAIATEA